MYQVNGKAKNSTPLLRHFSTDLFETQNQERYPGYDPACMHEIWHVDSFYGPTYELTIILNKNKIQDGGRRHLGFLHKH